MRLCEHGCRKVSETAVRSLMAGHGVYDRGRTKNWVSGLVGVSFTFSKYSALWDTWMVSVKDKCLIEGDIARPCQCDLSADPGELLLKKEVRDQVKSVFGPAVTMTMLMRLPPQLVCWENAGLVSVRPDGVVERTTGQGPRVLLNMLEATFASDPRLGRESELTLDDVLMGHSYLHAVVPRFRHQVYTLFRGEVTVKQFFAHVPARCIAWDKLASLFVSETEVVGRSGTQAVGARFLQLYGQAWAVNHMPVEPDWVNVFVRGVDVSMQEAPVVLLGLGQSFIPVGDMTLTARQPVVVSFDPGTRLVVGGVTIDCRADVRILLSNTASVTVYHDPLVTSRVATTPVWVSTAEDATAQLLRALPDWSGHTAHLSACRVIVLNPRADVGMAKELAAMVTLPRFGDSPECSVVTTDARAVFPSSFAVVEALQTTGSKVVLDEVLSLDAVYGGEVGLVAGNHVVEPDDGLYEATSMRLSFGDTSDVVEYDEGVLTSPTAELGRYLHGDVTVPREWLRVLRNQDNFAQVLFRTGLDVRAFLHMSTDNFEMDYLCAASVSWYDRVLSLRDDQKSGGWHPFTSWCSQMLPVWDGSVGQELIRRFRPCDLACALSPDAPVSWEYMYAGDDIVHAVRSPQLLAMATPYYRWKLRTAGYEFAEVRQCSSLNQVVWVNQVVVVPHSDVEEPVKAQLSAYPGVTVTRLFHEMTAPHVVLYRPAGCEGLDAVVFTSLPCIKQVLMMPQKSFTYVNESGVEDAISRAIVRAGNFSVAAACMLSERDVRESVARASLE